MAKHSTFVIGITGGIGCGKSTAAACFQKLDIPVLDADRLSHEATAPDGLALDEIRATFGDQFFTKEGALDRHLLAQHVFQDRNALDQLSNIVHRQVVAQLLEGVALAKKKRQPVICLDVPIPVKEGFLNLADFVLVIWASEEERLKRLAKRGMPEAEARRRMALQMTEEEYRAIGNLCLENNGSLEDLEQQIHQFIRQELHQRGIRIPLPSNASAQ